MWRCDDEAEETDCDVGIRSDRCSIKKSVPQQEGQTALREELRDAVSRSPEADRFAVPQMNPLRDARCTGLDRRGPGVRLGE